MTFGYSRDDAEGGFLLKYVEDKILPYNPFQTLDDAVVGLMKIAVDKGRATRPDLELGICGEHGGDPESIAKCESIGLDYVSCSPFRVPVARLAAAQAAMAGVAFVQLVPTVVIGLIAGSLADAFDRRRLLLITNIGMAASTAMLLALALVPSPPIALLFVGGFLSMAFSSVDQPTRLAATPRLVPPERLPAAITLNQLSGQASSIVGPAIAGILLAISGPAGAYAFDLATFVFAFSMLLRLRAIPHLGAVVKPGLQAIREGLSFARRKRILLSTFVLDLNAMIFGMPTALFPVLALEVFDAGPAGVGFLAAAPAIGGVLATVFSGWVGSVRRVGLGILIVVAIWGVMITLFGLASFSFALALVFLTMAGTADVLSAVFRATLLQVETPDDLRGRLSAIHVMVVRAGPRLGDMEAAVVASIAGAQFAVVSGGIMCLIGLVAIARRFPELGAYERRLGEVVPER
jgi:MFS family permease